MEHLLRAHAFITEVRDYGHILDKWTDGISALL